MIVFAVMVLPIIGMFLLVGAMHWLLDRLFGYDPLDPYEVGFQQKVQAEFMQNAGSHSNRKEKETPHYDAFVEAELRASRLEDAAYEEDLDGVYSLSDLLEKRERD